MINRTKVPSTVVPLLKRIVQCRNKGELMRLETSSAEKELMTELARDKEPGEVHIPISSFAKLASTTGAILKKRIVWMQEIGGGEAERVPDWDDIQEEQMPETTINLASYF